MQCRGVTVDYSLLIWWPVTKEIVRTAGFVIMPSFQQFGHPVQVVKRLQRLENSSVLTCYNMRYLGEEINEKKDTRWYMW